MKETPISRRDFLKLTIFIAAGALGAACTSSPLPVVLSASPDQTPTIPPAATREQPVATTTEPILPTTTAMENSRDPIPATVDQIKRILGDKLKSLKDSELKLVEQQLQPFADFINRLEDQQRVFGLAERPNLPGVIPELIAGPEGPVVSAMIMDNPEDETQGKSYLIPLDMSLKSPYYNEKSSHAYTKITVQNDQQLYWYGDYSGQDPRLIAIRTTYVSQSKIVSKWDKLTPDGQLETLKNGTFDDIRDEAVKYKWAERHGQLVRQIDIDSLKEAKPEDFAVKYRHNGADYVDISPGIFAGSGEQSEVGYFGIVGSDPWTTEITMSSGEIVRLDVIDFLVPNRDKSGKVDSIVPWTFIPVAVSAFPSDPTKVDARFVTFLIWTENKTGADGTLNASFPGMIENKISDNSFQGKLDKEIKDAPDDQNYTNKISLIRQAWQNRIGWAIMGTAPRDLANTVATQFPERIKDCADGSKSEKTACVMWSLGLKSPELTPRLPGFDSNFYGIIPSSVSGDLPPTYLLRQVDMVRSLK